jgi:hypothetical protein
MEEDQHANGEKEKDCYGRALFPSRTGPMQGDEDNHSGSDIELNYG